MVIARRHRKRLYKQLRRYVGEVFRRLAEQKEGRIEDRAFDDGPRGHVDLDTTEARGGAGSGVSRRQACNSRGSCVWRAQVEVRGALRLGTGLLGVDGTA